MQVSQFNASSRHDVQPFVVNGTRLVPYQLSRVAQACFEEFWEERQSTHLESLDGYGVDTNGRDGTERPLGRAGPISTR
jgi:hypothetical protein